MTTTTITCATPKRGARLTVRTDEVGAAPVMSRATARGTAPTTLARAPEFSGDIGSISGCFRKAELALAPLQQKGANHG